MSKQANKTLIGAFVVSAIALLIICVAVFGSGKFLSKRQKYVMYFDGSVKGLQIGSPVTFRGVKIGEVTDIVLHFDPSQMQVLIPVYAEIDPAKFQTGHEKIKPYEYYKALLNKGIRARLEMQSFVTGQLVVGADFYPNTPLRLVGLDKRYPEIPTIPTTMEELQKTIQDLPLKEITARLDNVLAGLDKLVNSPELNGSFASLNQTFKDVDRFVKNVDAQVETLTASVTKTSESARSVFGQAEKTLAMKEGVPGEIASDLKDTLKSARLMLDETKKSVEGINQITAQNANLGYELNRSLEQMTALSRSLRSLTDYLERHPEAFIRGKNSSKGD